MGVSWFGWGAVSSSRPADARASRAAAVKDGRRPPPQAARSVLDGSEHDAILAAGLGEKPAAGTFSLDRKGERSMHQFHAGNAANQGRAEPKRGDRTLCTVENACAHVGRCGRRRTARRGAARCGVHPPPPALLFLPGRQAPSVAGVPRRQCNATPHVQPSHPPPPCSGPRPFARLGKRPLAPNRGRCASAQRDPL